MEFRLMVNGQPVTDWEAIRARDVGLWKQSTRTSMQLTSHDVIEAQSRRTDQPDNPTKAQLKDQAALLGLDVPVRATKAELIALIESA